MINLTIHDKMDFDIKFKIALARYGMAIKSLQMIIPMDFTALEETRKSFIDEIWNYTSKLMDKKFEEYKRDLSK